MSFRDGSEQWNTAFADAYDSTRDVTYHEDVPLAEFFARPVKVAAFTWATSDVTPFYQAVDPWSLFINNTRVANRMSNFQNFSGNLHVKFVINGNSFLYGRLMAEYFPLKAYDLNSAVGGTAASDINNVVQASQRLHIFLDPCESQAGELTLPFIWFYDKISLPAGEFANLGQLYIRQLQALKHANAATGSVNITMFVWATNVKLSIPTTFNISGLTAQGGKFDEYGTGPISGLASAVSKAAGSLTRIPYIGKYAKATSMITSSMGQVAALFGFSKPAIIGDYTDVRPTYVSRLATVDGGDNVGKLTLDSKQELTIDPSVVGLSGADELSITAIACKESYLTQFPWTVARVPNDMLFSILVRPPFSYLANRWYLPAVTYASLPFKYWRGSLIYRFQIVASGYHKGRILIVYDPYNQQAAETNIQYSKIVDLADERDFTFEVGWGQPNAWADVPTLSVTNPYRTTTPWSAVGPTNNGAITVYVLNELTVPNSTVNNDISINVFVSGCGDFKVAVPDETQIATLVPLPSSVPQSGTFEEVATENKNAPRNEDAKETFAMCEPLADATDLVYMGESFTSFRQLMKRYTLYTILSTVVPVTGGTASTYISMPDFPPNRGYSAYGMTSATLGGINPAFTSMLNYLGMAYLGYRGGVRWKVLIEDSVQQLQYPTSVSRLTVLNSYVTPWLTTVADVSSTTYAYIKNRMNNSDSMLAGAHATVNRQPVLEFETPFYHKRRFSSTRNLGAKAAFAADDLSHRISTRTFTGNTQVFTFLVGAAEDSTFVGFQGAPPLQFQTLPAT